MPKLAMTRPTNYVPQHWSCSGCGNLYIKLYDSDQTMPEALEEQGWTARDNHLYCAACSEFYPGKNVGQCLSL